VVHSKYWFAFTLLVFKKTGQCPLVSGKGAHHMGDANDSFPANTASSVHSASSSSPTTSSAPTSPPISPSLPTSPSLSSSNHHHGTLSAPSSLSLTAALASASSTTFPPSSLSSSFSLLSPLTALVKRVQVLVARDKPEAALRDIDNAGDISQGDHEQMLEILRLKGECLRRLRRFGESEEVLTSAIDNVTIAPSRAPLLLELALTHLELGKTDAAINELQFAHSLTPTAALARTYSQVHNNIPINKTIGLSSLQTVTLTSK
jgi:hypothetical protein